MLTDTARRWPFPNGLAVDAIGHPRKHMYIDKGLLNEKTKERVCFHVLCTPLAFAREVCLIESTGRVKSMLSVCTISRRTETPA